MHEYILLSRLGLPNAYAGFKPVRGTVHDSDYDRSYTRSENLFTVWLQGEASEPSLYAHGMPDEARRLFDLIADRLWAVCPDRCNVTLWQHKYNCSSSIKRESVGGLWCSVCYDDAKLLDRAESAAHLKGLGP